MTDTKIPTQIMDRKLWLHETVDRLGLHDLWTPEIALAIAPLTEHEFTGVLCQGMINRIQRRYQDQKYRDGEKCYEINGEIQRRDNVKLMRNLARLPATLDSLVLEHLRSARFRMLVYIEAAISFPQGYEAIMKETHRVRRIQARLNDTLTNYMVYKSRLDTRDGPRRNFTRQSTYNFGNRPHYRCLPGNTNTDLYRSIPRNANIPCTWTFELPARVTGLY